MLVLQKYALVIVAALLHFCSAALFVWIGVHEDFTFLLIPLVLVVCSIVLHWHTTGKVDKPRGWNAKSTDTGIVVLLRMVFEEVGAPREHDLRVVLYEHGPKTRELVMREGYALTQIQTVSTLKDDQGVAGEAFQTCKLRSHVITKPVAAYYEGHLKFSQEDVQQFSYRDSLIKSALAVPVLDPDDRKAIGVIVMDSTHTDTFPQGEDSERKVMSTAQYVGILLKTSRR